MQKLWRYYSKIAEFGTGKSPPQIVLPREFSKQYLFQRRVGFFLSLFPGYRKLLALAARFGFPQSLVRAAATEQAFRNTLRGAPSADPNPIAFGSGWGYEDEVEDFRVAKFYQREIESGIFSAKETPALNRRAMNDLAKLLADGSYDRVVNFGVSFAYLDAKLAERNPGVNFTGVDRSESVKALNEAAFSKHSNLQFFAGDIMNWISEQEDLSSTLFLTIRTLVLLPKNFVESLFSALAFRELRGLSLYEPYGLSRMTNGFPLWFEGDWGSLLFRDSMWIHDYGSIAEKNGMKTRHHSYLETAHVDPDYRIEVAHFETPQNRS